MIVGLYFERSILKLDQAFQYASGLWVNNDPDRILFEKFVDGKVFYTDDISGLGFTQLHMGTFSNIDFKDFFINDYIAIAVKRIIPNNVSMYNVPQKDYVVQLFNKDDRLNGFCPHEMRTLSLADASILPREEFVIFEDMDVFPGEYIKIKFPPIIGPGIVDLYVSFDNFQLEKYNAWNIDNPNDDYMLDSLFGFMLYGSYSLMSGNEIVIPFPYEGEFLLSAILKTKNY